MTITGWLKQFLLFARNKILQIERLEIGKVRKPSFIQSLCGTGPET